MSTVLIVGDGPLAAGLADLARQAEHTVVAFLFNQQGYDHTPLARLPAFLQEVAEEVEIVVEAIVADRSIKRQAIGCLNNAFIGTEEPLLCSTLNASAAEIGQWVIEPGHVIGWAALPPLDETVTVEIMVGFPSEPGMTRRAQDFLVSLGKEPILIGDTAGGILPRVVANLVNEAAFALMDGIASAEDIDRAMQLGTNYPHGPLAWGDLVGLDQIMGVMVALGETAGPERYRPAPLLQRLVQTRCWGKRTGRGFFGY